MAPRLLMASGITAVLVAAPLVPAGGAAADRETGDDVPWGWPVAMHQLTEQYLREAAPILDQMRAEGTDKARPAPLIASASHEYEEALFFASGGFLSQSMEELTEFWSRFLYHRVSRDIQANGTDPAEAYYGTGSSYRQAASQALAVHRQAMAEDLAEGVGPGEFDYLLYSGQYAVLATYEGDKSLSVEREAPRGPPGTGVAVAYLAMAFSSWWYARVAIDVLKEGRALHGNETGNVTNPSTYALANATYPSFDEASQKEYIAPVTISYAASGRAFHDRLAEGPHFAVLYAAAEIEFVFAIAMEEASAGVTDPFKRQDRFRPVIERAEREATAAVERIQAAGFPGLVLTHHLDAMSLWNLSRGGVEVAGDIARYGHAGAALEAMRTYDFLIEANGLAPAERSREFPFRPILLGALLVTGAGVCVFWFALRRDRA